MCMLISNLSIVTALCSVFFCFFLQTKMTVSCWSFVHVKLCRHDNFQTLKGSCYFEVNPLTKTAIAAEVKYDLADDETTGVTVGAQHALFSWTLLKARLNNNGKVGGLIQQKFGTKFSITVAGEINLNEKAKEKFPKVGVSMALK